MRNILELIVYSALGCLLATLWIVLSIGIDRFIHTF